ncbi:DUF3040 domain-containing protein [Saccharopolyspora elongata]|uniref:DUF3040 domain-containing protein n=1 Tax=Saccharopolyspora elongata TaxID=2530387 RepID=UPI001F16A8AB|nr:DUF3040 domain-containing protein [Saccharopolyspora elongata]
MREIELWFEENDPGLAAYVREAPVRSPPDRRLRLLSATMVAGFVSLLGGIVVSLPALVLLGICLVVGGFAYMYYLKDVAGRPADHDER